MSVLQYLKDSRDYRVTERVHVQERIGKVATELRALQQSDFEAAGVIEEIEEAIKVLEDHAREKIKNTETAGEVPAV